MGIGDVDQYSAAYASPVSVAELCPEKVDGRALKEEEVDILSND